MRMKLIAAVVAGLFTSGSALAADDYIGGFVWQGSATLGGRGTNTDGGTRNGAYGTSSATLVPYAGPRGRRQGAGVPGHAKRRRSASST